MKEIMRYIDRFFKTNKWNLRYALTTDDMDTFMGGFRFASEDKMFHLISTLFEFGYAKGYRACLADTLKKGGAV